MENKDVLAVLKLVGLDGLMNEGSMYTTSADSKAYGSRQDLISRLMNITLHCLGAMRKLVIEGEKIRVAKDCTDIDGTLRDGGEETLLQRQLFSLAAKTMLDTIVQGKELLYTDPMKDLVDSYPWSHALTTPHWLMLPWALMETNLNASRTEQEQIETTRRVLKHYPDSMAEVDRQGQHYMTYAIRSQSLNLLEELLHYHREGAILPDGKGRRAIHYCAQFSQSVEAMVLLGNAAKKSLPQLLLSATDDYGNTPLHIAAGGCCAPELLKEILFSCPDAARARNNDGMLPLHVAAGKGGIEAVTALATAFPTGISVADRNHWLPIHHAAYDSREVEVVKYLHESLPAAVSKPQAGNGRLPIHYAAVKCLSSRVMYYLLSVYPEGARTFDVHRRLPLHNLIARCDFMNAARLRCLRQLLEVYPYAASMADEEGRTPLDLARRDNHGPLVLRLLLRADPGQDPEALAELTFHASRAKYRHRRRSRSDRRRRRSEDLDSRCDYEEDEEEDEEFEEGEEEGQSSGRGQPDDRMDYPDERKERDKEDSRPLADDDHSDEK